MTGDRGDTTGLDAGDSGGGNKVDAVREKAWNDFIAGAQVRDWRRKGKTLEKLNEPVLLQDMLFDIVITSQYEIIIEPIGIRDYRVTLLQPEARAGAEGEQFYICQNKNFEVCIAECWRLLCG